MSSDKSYPTIIFHSQFKDCASFIVPEYSFRNLFPSIKVPGVPCAILSFCENVGDVTICTPGPVANNKADVGFHPNIVVVEIPGNIAVKAWLKVILPSELLISPIVVSLFDRSTSIVVKLPRIPKKNNCDKGISAIAPML